MEEPEKQPLSYYLSWIPNDELNRQIDDKNRRQGQIINKDLGSIADRMPHWIGNIATSALKLTPPEIAEIQGGQYQGNIRMQKREALQKWKSRLGIKGTPKALITSFYEADEIPCVQAACSVLGNEPEERSQEMEMETEANSTTNRRPVTDSGDIIEDPADATVPPTQTEHDLSASSTSTSAARPKGAYSAALLRDAKLWGKKDICVYFENSNLLDKWRIDDEDILKWANRWQGKEPNYIPKFKPATRAKRADVIVELNENDKKESLPGDAKRAGSTDPTMWLDLSQQSDKYHEYLVVHEFGHALGLGHEHQRSDFRECIIPFLDEAEMKKDLKEGYNDLDWETDTLLDVDNASEYDPESVMHYWFRKEWLKHGYDKKEKIGTMLDKGILSEKMSKALLSVHDMSGKPLPTHPSTKDLEFLNGVYKKKFHPD